MDFKKMKKNARGVLKKHYWLFVMVCLFASMIGVDNTDAFARLRSALNVSVDVRNDVIYNSEAGLADIYYYVFGDEEEPDTYGTGKYKKIGPVELGRADGVFAKTINGITSGSFLVRLFYIINSFARSESAAVVIFLAIIILTAFFVWFFICRVVMVISRRLFLESRLYAVIPPGRISFLIRVRKWFHVAVILMRSFFVQLAWWFTIAGGFISYYAYILVPYIAAENPDIPAKEALRLSKTMMKGRKWKLFCMHLSFIGWKLLGLLTLGLLDTFYTVPYMTAFFGEFYAARRAEAIEEKLPGYEFLNDRYLFEYAEQETLYGAYADLLTDANVVEQPGARSRIGEFFASVFGIVLKTSKREQAWCEYEEDQIRRHTIEKVMQYEAYPRRLFTLPEKNLAVRPEKLHYIRHYSLSSIVIMFFAFSFVGWIWEVSIHLVEDGMFVNRGVMHGPWLPIYGSGALLILIALNRFRKNPWLEFLLAILLCGVVEYFTSWLLEVNHGGTKWWDYTGYFININGRICAEGLLVFGIGGMAVVYFMGPLLDNVLRRIRGRYIFPLCAILVIAFVIDMIYSHYYPNMGAGITDYGAKKIIDIVGYL